MKRRLVLAVVLVATLAVCASLWMNEGPLRRLVMLKRVPVQFLSLGEHLFGWESVKR